MIRIYLDFDGCLHPALPGGAAMRTDANGRTSRYFVHAPALANALRPFEVEIVISSIWRRANRLEELRRLLGAELGRRVVGTTALRRSGLTRYEEIIEHLARTEYKGNWLAIDDDDFGWGVAHRHLLIRPDFARGLAASDLAQLSRALGELIGLRPQFPWMRTWARAR